MIESTEQLQAGVRKCCNYMCMLESLQFDCTAYLNTPIDVQRACQAKPWSQSVEKETVTLFLLLVLVNIDLAPSQD